MTLREKSSGNGVIWFGEWGLFCIIYFRSFATYVTRFCELKSMIMIADSPHRCVLKTGVHTVSDHLLFGDCYKCVSDCRGRTCSGETWYRYQIHCCLIFLVLPLLSVNVWTHCDAERLRARLSTARKERERR